MTDLRDRQRATTREQIIDAVLRLLEDEHPATISMPQVAERAGVSLRTLYRYFPTKETLLDATAEPFTVSVEQFGGAVGLDDVASYLAQSWSGFAESVGAIRAQNLTAVGREARDRRVPHHRKTVRAALRDEGVDLPKADLDRLVDLIVLLMSSAAFLELVDRLGHDPEDAARTAAWAVRALVHAAEHEGAVAR